MGNRFKFRAVLKTDTHSIIAEPYYIFDNGYFVNIDDVQKPFEKKYPDDCFWEFIEEIEKQENCQEVSTDSEIIIFDSFDGLIQCTGLKDKNGKLIYEGDIVKFYFDRDKIIGVITWDNEHQVGFYVNTTEYYKDKYTTNYDFLCGFNYEVIGNIYENKELFNE